MAAEADDSECQYNRVRSVNNVTETNPAEIINGNAIRSNGPGPPGDIHHFMSETRCD